MDHIARWHVAGRGLYRIAQADRAFSFDSRWISGPPARAIAAATRRRV
ncbi:hypothetical protein I552_6482 [Mycobacterium xenopi 3993]|nr:hypothetical protein I552_6482 [Mycobacterium xenopi 3993]